ncbi:chaperonin 10-like protein [Mycena filopes]|nr:chaperonin 10-like protein [Mycena filopes]
MAIPTTMLAAVYVPGNQSLVLKKDYPIRELADNEILLKVAAAGICHTDVAWLSGVSLDTRTFVMGHEICGVPVKLGAKVDEQDAQIGKLYSILLIDGSVQNPTNGGPAILSTYGLGMDGGYAEYFIGTAELLVPVPSGVPPEVAAIASDAGVTAYHAIQNGAKVKPGDKVLIFGIGGLGHLGLQYAKHLGATVYVCDFKSAARKLALELGATEAFDLIELTNKTAAGFTVTTTVDFIANNQSEGVSSETKIPSDPFNLAMAALRVVGSTYGPRSALVEVLNLFAKGIVKAHVSSEPLENVNKVIDELRAFEITGRKVVIPHHAAH